MTFKRLTACVLTAACAISAILPAGDGSRAEDAAYEFSNPALSYETKDCIYFGNYWQEDTNKDGSADEEDEKTPIRWIVLSAEGDDAFLLAEKCLGCGPFSEGSYESGWQDSSVREWLNGEFYSEAFGEEEKAAVKATKVMSDNIYTSDKVYLLSANEIDDTENGAGLGLAAQALVTDYADAGTSDSYTYIGSESFRNWWLRPEYSADYAGYVDESGKTAVWFNYIRANFYIRPVIHIDLSAAPHEDAGKIRCGIGDARYDCIYFGNYWQEDTNGDGNADKGDEKMPIRWRVLSVSGSDAFVMADRCLDYMPYNILYEDASWETCDVRKWLNGEFYDAAFSDEEKKAIKVTRVDNSSELAEELKDGNDTDDRIYLLSFDEAVCDGYGFPASSSYDTALRRTGKTEYAYEAQSSYEGSDGNVYSTAWLIRDCMPLVKICINDGGAIYRDVVFGEGADFIRPVMHIDLSAGGYEDAGNVLVSDKYGREEDTVVPAPTSVPEDLPTLAPTAAPEPSPSPAPTRNPATQPPDEVEKPWPDGAYCYEFDLSEAHIGGNSRYVENSDGSVTAVYKGEHPDISFPSGDGAHMDDYYRWMEITYCDSDGDRGVSVYDKFIDYAEPWNSGENTKYDLGSHFLKEYAGDCVAVIDMASLPEWDGYPAQVDIYAPVHEDGYSDGGRITVKSIKLYSESTEPPPAPTMFPAASRPPANTEAPQDADPSGQHGYYGELAETDAPDGGYADEGNFAGNIPPESGGKIEAGNMKPQKAGKKLAKPSFSAKKKKKGGIKYIEIRLNKYEGKYIQVYVKTGGRKYKRVSFDNIRIKKYKGVFKIQYVKDGLKVRIKVRTYKIKGKKRIYSRYSDVVKIAT